MRGPDGLADDGDINMKTNKIELLEKNNDKRTKCAVYTRVMGYHRPVESFNIGKTGEHKDRKQFVEK